MNLNNNEIIGFKEIKLSTTTTAAGEYVYEIKLQNDEMSFHN